jgi:hypothetical protein
MYQAIIIACMVGAPAECITLETQRWHETERTCKADALFMAQKVHVYMRGYKASRWDCRHLPKGALTR